MRYLNTSKIPKSNIFFKQNITMIIKMKLSNYNKILNGFESRRVCGTCVLFCDTFSYYDCFVYVNHR